MKIILANPRGFCAGVDRAIDIVKASLTKYGAPIYVRHEVVHNRYVVEDLKSQGAIFVDELHEVPDDAIVIFSAHGVSQAVRREAEERSLKLVLDATCPLVSKVHMEVVRYSRKGFEMVLIGHAGHAEVEGTLGQYQNEAGAIHLVESVEDVAKLTLKNPSQCYYVTQTTLSVDDTKAIIDALREKFPLIDGPRKDDICYATQNRQDAVKKLASVSDLVLVVGSKSSSNSNRLRELASLAGIDSYLIDGPEDINPEWFEGIQHLGLTAGASAPEILVQRVIDYVRTLYPDLKVEQLEGLEEQVQFSLPKEVKGILTKSPETCD